MNSKYTTRKVFLVITALFGTVSMCTGQEPKGEVIDKIVAKVDDYAILMSEVEMAYLDLQARGDASGDQDRCLLLQSLVTQKMLLAQAELDSIIVLDAEVAIELDRRMSYFISSFGGTQEELEDYYGKPLGQIQDEIQDELRDQMTVSRMRDEITQEVTVTPSEIRRFFSDIPKDSLPYFSEEVTVGQIVKKPKISATQKAETESFLFDIRSRILDGEDFGEMARKYSQDPGSASNGGEYPNFIKRGQFVPAFEATAFSLKVGEISDPVETEFGFHLIELLDRRGNEYRARHILVTPNITPDDIARTRHTLDSIRNLITVDMVPFETIAKDFSDDKFTGQNGGYFTDGGGAARIPTDQLDPSLYFTLDTMQVNTISTPVEYTMPDGKKALRLIYFKGEYRPHQANLKDDWQKIKAAALNEKKVKAESDWFQESKGSFFILIEPDYDCNILGRK